METWTNEYDTIFQRSSRQHFGPETDWLWFKAQGIAESGLDPRVLSPVGAIGLMQVMPGTAAEMAERLDIDNLPYIPDLNINMGIGYDRRCWNVWRDETGIERLRFMFGSYNAGIGNIAKAQRLAAKNGFLTGRWESIVETLPQVTRQHAAETIAYVARIEKIYSQLKEDHHV